MGSYHIIEKLGQGGMGQVYRARQEGLGRIVALKTASQEVIEDGVLLDRFRREVKLLSRLSHPHIVRVFDSGVLGGKPFFVMELIEGPSLESVVSKQGPLSADRARLLIGQLAEALAYLHAQGITHRDIKPMNLVLTRKNDQDHLVLVDFGLARAYSATPLTHAGEVVGTVAFLAPELLRGGIGGTPQDVWALGATAFQLVTGHRLFDGTSAARIISQVLEFDQEGVRNALVGMPGWFVDLVSGCMKMDPEDRPTAADCARILRDVAEAPGRVTTITPSGRIVELPAPPKRRVLTAAHLGAGGLVTLLALGLGFWAGSGRVEPPRATATPASVAVEAGDPASASAQTMSDTQSLEDFRQWHESMYRRIDPAGISKSSQDQYWLQLMVGLARTTRAPLKSLNEISASLLSTDASKQADKKRVLVTLALHCRETLASWKERAPKLLSGTVPEVTSEDRWMVFECLTPLRILDLLLQVYQLDQDRLGAEDWLAEDFRPVKLQTDPVAHWEQARIFIYCIQFDPERTTQVDVLDAIRRPKNFDEGLDAITGKPKKIGVHSTELAYDLAPASPGRDDRTAVSFDAMFETVMGQREKILFPQDVLWVRIGEHRPFPMTTQHLWLALRPPNYLMYRLRHALPAGSLGKGATTKLRITREFVDESIATGGQLSPLYVGWVSLSAAAR